MYFEIQKMRTFFLFIILTLTVSCADSDAIRKENAVKAAQKEQEIFKLLSEKWVFKPADFSEESYTIVQQWSEWNMFYNELLQKPQTDIGAFQRKTKTLIDLSYSLHSTIPPTFNVVQIQSRFMVLETKLKMLKTYISLDDIPMEKTIEIIGAINTGIESIVNRMTTILAKNKIQREEGEIELLNSIAIPHKEVTDDAELEF